MTVQTEPSDAEVLAAARAFDEAFGSFLDDATMERCMRAALQGAARFRILAENAEGK